MLKVSKLHLVRRMSSLKNELDAHFERLLEKLNSLTGEILLKCLGDNPKKNDKDEISAYFVNLQLEITEKIQKLRAFQDELNSHCGRIHIKIEFANLSGPSRFQGPSGAGMVPKNHKYVPVHHLLPSKMEKPW